MTRSWIALVVLAACGSDRYVMGVDAPQGTDAGATDSQVGCSVTIKFTPSMAVAPLTVYAKADVMNGPGVIDYEWTIKENGTTVIPTTFGADHSEIHFDATTPDFYDATVKITPPGPCLDGMNSINVMAMGAHTANYRLRAWPPPSLAPTQEQVVQVYGGADFEYPITLAPGIAIAGAVTSGASGVAAYLRFMPVATPDAYVETFSGSSGSYGARLLGEAHQVLIVPTAPGLAPRLASWSPTTSNDFALGAGNSVTGTVLDSGGVALAGAQVQLAVGGLPSSLATTAANGTFTVHESFAAGANVTVVVVPPVGRGLPRLTATAAFDLTQPLQIHYATLATCNVSGTAVQRGGTNEANAAVTFVGALAATAGTISAGTSANAAGTVQIATAADGTGHLPSVLVPRVPLSAVITVTPGDLAVATANLSTCPPASIVAPAQVMAAGTIVSPAQMALGGAQVTASPAGALAAAGAPPVADSATSSGAYALAIATGGVYDVRFSDPLGRAAPLVLLGTSSTALPATATLVPAIHITGALSVSGSATVVSGTSVQVLCTACSGLDAERPIAETATDPTGRFKLAVPDPGTM
jgi:hypothetical protein